MRSPEEARRLVLDVLAAHADSLLRVARRHSVCLDDAQDAYQRAVEIFLTHAATLGADEAHKWLFTVAKHEAMAVRRARLRMVGDEEPDLDRHEALDVAAPDEKAIRFERMARSAEALRQLKPQELRALWLRAQGHSYQEIAEITSWSYTKVNRCITEGRRSFLTRYEGIETGAECRRWEPVLSAMADGEATAADLAQVRPHLRNCAGCRATVRVLRESNAGLAALLPIPAVAAGASAAPHHADAAGGFFARLHDALATGLQDRVVGTALKFQSGVEAVSAAKVAALAASAAAIGGGVAVEQVVTRLQRATRHRVVVAHPSAVRAAATVAVRAPSRPLPRIAPRVTRTSTRRAEFHVARHPRAHASAAAGTAAREFVPPTATAASVQPAPAPRRSAAARTTAREFGVG